MSGQKNIFHLTAKYKRIKTFINFFFSGVTPLEILFSHVITQFVVMCGQTALVLIFMIVVFGVECKGDISLVIALTILQGLCGMCFGKWKHCQSKYVSGIFFLSIALFQVLLYQPFVNLKETPSSWPWEVSILHFCSVVRAYFCFFSPLHKF